MKMRQIFKAAGYTPKDPQPWVAEDELGVLKQSALTWFFIGDRYVQLRNDDAYKLGAWLAGGHIVERIRRLLDGEENGL